MRFHNTSRQPAANARYVKPERVLPGQVVQMGGSHYYITRSGAWQRATDEQIQKEAHLRAVETAVHSVTIEG